jgi:hypothetical protein
MTKYLIILLIFAVPIFALEQLSKKDRKQFNLSYDMLKDGYGKQKYSEVAFFGKKTMDDYKIIPLDNRLTEEQKKYVEIGYLINKAQLHLSLQGMADTLIVCSRQDDYACMKKQTDRIKDMITGCGILDKKDEPERSYFNQFFIDANRFADSIPLKVMRKFETLDASGKKEFVEKNGAFNPAIKVIQDSLVYQSLDETYYDLMNRGGVEDILTFLGQYPRYEKCENLKNRMETIIGDDYRAAIKQKDIEVYQGFIDKYKILSDKNSWIGEKVKDIENRLEYQMMKKAIETQSVYLCRNYMDKYQNGKYFREVAENFDALTRGEKKFNQKIPDYDNGR